MKHIFLILSISFGFITSTVYAQESKKQNCTTEQQKSCDKQGEAKANCTKDKTNCTKDKSNCTAEQQKACDKQSNTKANCTKDKANCSSTSHAHSQPQYEPTKEVKGNTVTETFTVYGLCHLCKTRIEKAALMHGVKSAQWDLKTDVIKVVYDQRKIEALAIHKAIAEVGHKTSLVEPNMDAYNKFPACCAYLEEGAQKHGL